MLTDAVTKQQVPADTHSPTPPTPERALTAAGNKHILSGTRPLQTWDLEMVVVAQPPFH